jgi:hypothetical protein
MSLDTAPTSKTGVWSGIAGAVAIDPRLTGTSTASVDGSEVT